MTCADGIQEYIETVRDLKANNAEDSYLKGLKEKIRGVESGAISAELVTAVFVTSAGMILKLGIATVVPCRKHTPCKRKHRYSDAVYVFACRIASLRPYAGVAAKPCGGNCHEDKCFAHE